MTLSNISNFSVTNFFMFYYLFAKCLFSSLESPSLGQQSLIRKNLVRWAKNKICSENRIFKFNNRIEWVMPWKWITTYVAIKKQQQILPTSARLIDEVFTITLSNYFANTCAKQTFQSVINGSCFNSLLQQEKSLNCQRLETNCKSETTVG